MKRIMVTVRAFILMFAFLTACAAAVAAEPGEPHFTLYAESAYNAIPITTKDIPPPPAGPGKMPASNSEIAFYLAAGLSEWTGYDFTLNDVTSGEDSVTVDWSADSTLIAWLDDRERNMDFYFRDPVDVNMSE